ncbi:MAG: hypothetical protein HY610_04965, partial [Elusimicrobia bacterium]|nr:hypothetical protein [Elusimicrobiota bacterium]
MRKIILWLSLFSFVLGMGAPPFSQARRYARNPADTHTLRNATPSQPSPLSIAKVLGEKLVRDGTEKFLVSLSGAGNSSQDLNRYLFAPPFLDSHTGETFVLASIQDRDHQTHCVLVFSKQRKLVRVLKEDRQIIKTLTRRKFVAPSDWQFKDVRTGRALWEYYFVAPLVNEHSLTFKRLEIPALLAPVVKRVSMPSFPRPVPSAVEGKRESRDSIPRLGFSFRWSDVKRVVSHQALWEWMPYNLPFFKWFKNLDWRKIPDFVQARRKEQFHQDMEEMEFRAAILMSLAMAAALVNGGNIFWSLPVMAAAALLKSIPSGYLFASAHRNIHPSRWILGSTLSLAVVFLPVLLCSEYQSKIAPVTGQNVFVNALILLTLVGLSWILGVLLSMVFHGVYDHAVDRKWLPSWWKIADMARNDAEETELPEVVKKALERFNQIVTKDRQDSEVLKALEEFEA